MFCASRRRIKCLHFEHADNRSVQIICGLITVNSVNYT